MIDADKREVDRTLIRENLKLTPLRIEKLMALQKLSDELGAQDARQASHD